MSSKISMALGALFAAGAALSLPTAAAGQEDAMVVVRDAQTGRLRNATPAEVKVLRAQQAPVAPAMLEAEPGVVTIRTDGTMHKHLGERGMVYSVATRDANGKLGMQCVKGEHAAAALARPASAATHQEHDHESR